MCRRLVAIGAITFAALIGLNVPALADANDIDVAAKNGYTFHKTCTTCAVTFNPGSTGPYRYLLVEVSVGTNQAVTAISFAGTALSQIGVRNDGKQYIYMFEWANWLVTTVPTTSGTLSVTIAGGLTDVAMTAVVFINVGSHGTVVSANGQSTNTGTGEPAVSVATGDRHAIIDGVNANNGTTTLTSTTVNGDGYSAVLLENIDTNAGGGGGAEANLAESAETGGSTSPVTMSWNLTKAGVPVKDNWVMLAVDLVPFTQPTAITVGNFAGERCGNTTTLRWQTVFENRNVGFHLYRDVDGRRTRITPALVPGSALFSASGRLDLGRAYSWNDVTDRDAAYWLEEIDTNGRRTMHGPAFVREECSSPARSLPRARTAAARNTPRPLSSRPSDAPSPSRRRAVVMPGAETQQWNLAAGAAIKLTVAAPGWYRVSGAELLAAGIDPAVDPRNLQLFVDGVQQPMAVIGSDDGTLAADDAIEFYGTGADTYWTDARVYWLVDGKTRGERLIVTDARSAASAASGSFRATVSREERTTYYSNLTQGNGENFFGSLIAADPVDETIPLHHIVPDAADAIVEVSLQGLTTADHVATVRLNGSPVGSVTFRGFARGTGRFTAASSLLREGANTVTFASTAGADDVSAIDVVSISYSHAFTAENDALFFSTASRPSVTVGGFTSSAIRVFDVTYPASPRELLGTIDATGGSFAVTVALPDLGTHQLLALTSAQLSHPRSIAANKPSTLHAPDNRGAFLVITHGSLASALPPLVTLHQAEGLTVAVADIEDVYDEFNFGKKDPGAIKSLLAASRSWQQPPKFVLLVGDASFDPRNYLGFGDLDLVPTHFIATSQMETASDDWFVDFDDDSVPDLPIGRFAVGTAQEAANLVGKTVTYAQSPQAGWNRQALIVADVNDADFDFEKEAGRAASLMPSMTTSIDRLGSGVSKAQLVSQINAGAEVVEFIGHGSVEQWGTHAILTSDDAQTLANGPRTPFVIAMTCLGGLFHDIYATSLAEALMNAQNGGAVAVWASSSLTQPDGQATMSEALLRALFAGSPAIGEAILAAKQQAIDPDVRASWILFGDPALRLK